MNLEAHRVVDFPQSQVMSIRLKKVCPQCDATLHARKLACPCGQLITTLTSPIYLTSMASFMCNIIANIYMASFMFNSIIPP